MKQASFSSRLLLALLCGGLFTPLHSGPAFASTPELYFYPSGQWDLTQKAQKCAVQNTFNNGFILQFTGGESWVEGLNINFRQAIFKPGEPYKAQITAPGAQTETLQATARDSETLTLNFLGRKELFKALKTGAVMDLKIDENNFRFYLTNFAGAANNFEKCMAGGVLQAQAPTPEQTQSYTENEAIAMEEEAISASEAPLPVVAEIPFTETKKVGGEVIDPNAPIEPQTEQIGKARIEAEAIPVETKIVANNPVEDTTETAQSLTDLTPVSDEPIAGRASEPTNPSLKPMADTARPRMSDKIAQDIQNNPDLVDLDVSQTPASVPVSAPVSAPAPIINEKENLATSTLVIPEDVTRETLIPAGKNIDYSDMARAQLEGQAAGKLAVETSSEPMALEPEAKPEAKIEPVKEEVIFNAPRVTDGMDGSKPGANPPAAVEETFLAEVEPVMMPSPETLEEAAAPVPEEPVPAPEPEPEPTPEPITQRIETPAPIEHKQSVKREADFRDSGLNARPNEAVMARMAELEDLVGKLKAENLALNKELDHAISASEEERLSISTDNWNLEQATMRFNEAERQVKKLGMELQKERAQCSAEKRELEAQLFDPQITSQEQMARLAILEDQLRSCKAAQ